MQIVKVVTILDIEIWEARECFGPIFFKQLRQADLILLNKIDIVHERKVSRFLKELHETMPHARIVPTVQCEVEPEIVMDGRAMAPKLADYAAFNQHPDDRGAGQGSSDYISFTFRTADVLDEARFKQFTENLPLELFRMKGPVRLGDRTILVNYVGGKNQWSPWNDVEETCLVFVGWNVDEKETRQSLEKCVIPNASPEKNQ
jgi:G3E family GTPase